MSVLIKGGRVVTASDATVADVLVEGEKVDPARNVAGRGGRHRDRRHRQARAARRDRRAHAPRHAVRRHGHDRRLRDRARSPRRSAARPRIVDFAHPGARATTFARPRRPGTRRPRARPIDRLRLPHDHHRPRDGGTLDEMRDAAATRASPRYKLFMAYPGVLHGRRRDALPRAAAGRRRTGALVMHARRERRRHRRARQGGARGRAHRARSTTR